MNKTLKIIGYAFLGLFVFTFIAANSDKAADTSIVDSFSSSNTSTSPSVNTVTTSTDESSEDTTSVDTPTEIVEDEREPEQNTETEVVTVVDSPEVPTYRVIRVVDGDTIKVLYNGNEETVRYIGVNTPETVDPRKPVECYGKEASAFNASMVAGKSIVLVQDPGKPERDRYGRLLAYVELPDGTDVNYQLIVNGYAYEEDYGERYSRESSYQQAQRTAQASGAGLWTASCEVADNSQADTSGSNWYVSSHYRATYYYCESSDGWKSLSERYLKQYSSEAALLADYPDRTLHPDCQ